MESSIMVSLVYKVYIKRLHFVIVTEMKFAWKKRTEKNTNRRIETDAFSRFQAFLDVSFQFVIAYQ